MTPRPLKFILFFIGFTAMDIILSLFYFWAGQLSYGLLIAGSTLSLPAAIYYGEAHWHGPDPLLFVGAGVLSPLLAFLSLTPLWPLLRKKSFWIRWCLCLFWLGEIVAFGFFVPRLALR